MAGDARGPASTRPTRRAAGPSRATRSSAARPTKSPGLSSFTTRPRPASNGFVVAVELVAVERHAGLEPERVAGAQADGLQAVLGARLDERVPELARAVAFDEHLEAVLAGVAGPRDERRDAGDACPRRSRSSGARRGRHRSAAAGSRPTAGPGPRRAPVASDRSSRTALNFDRRSASASLTTGAFEALATTRNRSASSR